MRRSALDFLGGMQSMSLAQLSAILAAATRPFSADFAGDVISSSSICTPIASMGCNPAYTGYWPERAELEQIRSGDQRVAAAGSEPRAGSRR